LEFKKTHGENNFAGGFLIPQITQAQPDAIKHWSWIRDDWLTQNKIQVVTMLPWEDTPRT